MPASALDPVNAALRAALKGGREGAQPPEGQQLAAGAKRALLADIEFEPAGTYRSTVLDQLKTKYIVLKCNKGPEGAQDKRSPTEDSAPSSPPRDERLKSPVRELYPLDAVRLGWGPAAAAGGREWTAGAGMVNMGNTCYLNSTLQALFHVPALANWLMADRDQHSASCQDAGGLCIICAMRKTLQESQQRNVSSIRPLLIYNKLRLVCRNLIPGRQEDAHEFLRYLVEAMEKSYLNRFKNYNEFDSRTKETTPLNQILGGYLRSAVRCLKCGHVSTTFQHFQDLLVDIRKAQTLDEALELYFAREKLDDESYHCESCQKKVPATKQFSLERAPMVLCIQLKRFSVSNNKITKHVTFRQRLDLTRYARHKPNVPLVYRLVAIVTHMGPTVSCGHYTAVAQAPSGNFYQFDDSMVRPISHQAVFNTNAYIMLYELEASPYLRKNSPHSSPLLIKSKPSPPATETSCTTSISPILKPPIAVGFTSDKVYGPELPPTTIVSRTNGTVSSTDGDGSPPSSENSSDDGAVQRGPPSPSPPPAEADSSTPGGEGATPSPSHSSESQVSANASPDSSPQQEEQQPASKNPNRSLVPYDDDDSSCEEAAAAATAVLPTEARVSTKAAVGEWQVTSSTDGEIPSAGNRQLITEGHNWDGRSNGSVSASSASATVSELLRTSTGGYSSSAVASWNGTKARIEREVSNERREDRKRRPDGNNIGAPMKVKHRRPGDIPRSNPGYNPVQEYHNSKNWPHGGNGYNKPFFNGHRHRRNFHHKTFHHKPGGYRFR